MAGVANQAVAGVRHHIALSIVGTEPSPDNGYFRAKVAQEKVIESSRIPYTIIRSTQFMEFLGGIATSSTNGSAAHRQKRQSNFRLKGVSWISPIATALLKAQLADVLTMRTPAGTEELEIIAIPCDDLR